MTAKRTKGHGSDTASRVVKLFEQHYTAYQTTSGEPYAVPKQGLRIARMMRGGRHSLRSELARRFAETHGRVPSAQALVEALAVIQGKCMIAEEAPVHIRHARIGEAVFIDLGDSKGSAVRIIPGAWEVLTDHRIIFRRSELTLALPYPSPGSLDSFKDFLNLDESAFELVRGWLIAVLMGVPVPMLLLTGEQGTAKSSAARFIIGVIDPSAAPLRSEPRDLEALAVGANASFVVAFDNLSRVPMWMSDALCRLVTGEGVLRRRLYSDEELSVLALRKPLILTSIDPGALRGDFADRLLVLELERIPNRNRRREEDLERDWQKKRPAILGGLLEVLAKVLAEPLGDQRELPRMADFASVLMRVDAVLGSKSLKAYKDQEGTVSRDVVDSDPVLVAVREFITDQKEWAGTAGELLAQITPERPPKDWPGNPKGMGTRLKRGSPALRAIGITVERPEREGKDRARIWNLSLSEEVREEPSEPSAPSASPGQRADGLADGSIGADGWRQDGPSEPSAMFSQVNPPVEAVADDADGSLPHISEWARKKAMRSGSDA